MTTPQLMYREPMRVTLRRTVGIALVAGGVIAVSLGRPRAWLLVAVLALWPSFGGHWVEMLFLNWLRPRLPRARVPQIAARLMLWFVAGVALGFGVLFTMRLLPLMLPARTLPWWVGGVGFVTVELVAHLALSIRNRPSFYRGDG